MNQQEEDALIQESIYAMDCPVSGDRREAIRLAIRAAVAAERERCAKVAEEDSRKLRSSHATEQTMRIEAERKAEEAARDAGRYRWLRGNPCLPFGVTRYRSEPVEYYAGDSLDASIDAAIAAKGEA